MNLIHKAVLLIFLGILGFSLLFPGLIETFKPSIGEGSLIAALPDAKSQLRAFNAMTAALGALAFWAAFDVEGSRLIVISLGIVMGFVAASRIYSLIIDGSAGAANWLYLAVEAIIAACFLCWPPPGNG